MEGTRHVNNKVAVLVGVSVAPDSEIHPTILKIRKMSNKLDVRLKSVRFPGSFPAAAAADRSPDFHIN
jgi:hypothetical protein